MQRKGTAMMHDYWDYSRGPDIWSVIFMLLMLALLVVGIIAAARYIGHASNTAHEDEALALLKKRYASGEIDAQEFDEKRKVLSK